MRRSRGVDRIEVFRCGAFQIVVGVIGDGDDLAAE